LVWGTDSSGNYQSNPLPAVSGNSPALESFETTFNQDLNSDGTIGIPSVVLQTDGSTALTEVGNNFFLDNAGSGTGPELKYGGAAVTSGEFGAWTPIGAVQVAGGGYDVAWHNTSTDQYLVWGTDSSGNYQSNPLPAVSGNSPALESFETTFNQDLNSDGTIGIPAGSGSVAANLPSATGVSPDNFRFSSSAPGWAPAAPGVQNSTLAMVGGNSFLFALDHSSATTGNFTHSADQSPFNNTAVADIPAALMETLGGQGNAAFPDTAHTAQWVSHHSDFHFI
jgi:hypothetical protein